MTKLALPQLGEKPYVPVDAALNFINPMSERRRFSIRNMATKSGFQTERRDQSPFKLMGQNLNTDSASTFKDLLKVDQSVDQSTISRKPRHFLLPPNRQSHESLEQSSVFFPVKGSVMF